MRLLEEVNTTKGNAGGCGEAGQVLSLAVLFCLAKISVYAYKKNCKGKGYCKDGYGVVYYPVFSCSEDPFHPLGVRFW